MAQAIISHWGAEIFADVDWILEEPALSLLNHHLSDAFAEIEKWDLRVKKADVLINDGSVSITAYAEQTRDPNNVNYSKRIPEKAPGSVTITCPCCPECHMPRVDGKIHPDNGCPVAIIDYVMST